MSEKEQTEQQPVQPVKGGELYFLGFLFVFMIFVLIEALKQEGIFEGVLGGAGSLPQAISILLLILIILTAVDLLRKNYKEAKFKDAITSIFTMKVLGVIVLIILYAFILETLHFTLTTFLFLLACMIVLERGKYVTKLIVSVGMLVFVIVIFKYIFLIILP
ncbi:MAG: tripartite tricarboxylate transporter TctB family protein [Syntrophomonadaceae bacterium]|jgi:putative tricarboxylic transport membrane protein